MTSRDQAKEHVLAALRKDSRRSLRSMVRDLELSPTTVSKLVQKLEGENIIMGYSAHINWPKLGYDGTLCMHISTTPEANIECVGSRIKGLDPVLQVFYATGEITFMAYAACKTMLDASDVLQVIRTIEGVERFVPHSILRMI